MSQTSHHVSPWGEYDVSSGKGASDENFPVGSLFISKPLRPIVHAYYDYARVIDDIADCPDLSSEAKIARLNAMGEVLLGRRHPIERADALSAQKLRQAFLQADIPFETGTDLLVAFRADARGVVYRNFNDLCHYCRYSANPVGHFLLALHHEEDPKAREASDNLCTSLQILNHLQDCADDLKKLKRCYIPQDEFENAGITQESLLQSHSSPALRRVFNRLLDKVDILNKKAATLPYHVQKRRFRMECATITSLAHYLAHRLRTEDPLAGRVKLHKIDILKALYYGLKSYSLLSRN